jgi:hypothetical protein
LVRADPEKQGAGDSPTNQSGDMAGKAFWERNWAIPQSLRPAPGWQIRANRSRGGMRTIFVATLFSSGIRMPRHRHRLFPDGMPDGEPTT